MGSDTHNLVDNAVYRCENAPQIGGVRDRVDVADRHRFVPEHHFALHLMFLTQVFRPAPFSVQSCKPANTRLAIKQRWSGFC